MYPVDLLKVCLNIQFIFDYVNRLIDLFRRECKFYIRPPAGYIPVSRMRCRLSIELKVGGRCGRVFRV
jgi:hypothetical protein